MSLDHPITDRVEIVPEPDDAVMDGIPDFLAELESANNPARTMPEFMQSPFDMGIYERDVEIEVAELTHQGVPRITFYSDTHETPPLGSRRGYHGLSDGRRRVWLGLSRIKAVRNFTRRIDAYSRYAKRLLRPYLETRYEQGGMVVHGGDFCDSFVARDYLQVLAREEHEQQRCFDRGNQAQAEPAQTRTIHIVGNHDGFFRDHSSDRFDKDKKYKYDPIAEEYGSISPDEFKAMVSAVKQGFSLEQIYTAWRDTHPEDQRAIPPAMRWYLFKLVFGPQIGRYVEQDHGEQRHVSFLNSTIVHETGTPDALQQALSELGLDPDDQLHQDMMLHIKQEEKANAAMIDQALADAEDSERTVVYTHNPEIMQQALITRKTILLAAASGASEEGYESEAQQFVQENILVVGGHFHEGHDDIRPLPTGIKALRGFSRLTDFLLAQKPGQMPNMFTRKPYETDPPQILQGRADEIQPQDLLGVRGLDDKIRSHRRKLPFLRRS